MCQTCGCTPCKKCGREIKEGTCTGCKKPTDQCQCAPVREKQKAAK